MIPNPEDTIVALASAPGAGSRGIVRLSGPAVRSIIASVFAQVPGPWPMKRSLHRGHVSFPSIHSPLPADLYFSPAPGTYTGQDTAELHTISSPPLLDALIAAVMNAGARAAQPGEFTLRAFLSGKKDLPQAEAVAAVIDAGTSDELKQALGQLAGGVTKPLDGMRDDFLNLLADIEAALDFIDEDIEFVAKKDILMRLGKGLAQMMNLQKQLEERSVSDRPFRVVLAGESNAGKSSLFNALAGRPAAIVSPIPGTTRDYITRSVQLDGLPIELIDTAGWQVAGDTIEAQAQALGMAQAKIADLSLWCVDALQIPLNARSPSLALRAADPTVVLVATKVDIGSSVVDGIATSAKTGYGIAALKEMLADRARVFARPALAPSLSRCKHHVDRSIEHLRAAHSIALFDDPAELLALELRLALEQIGEMVGADYTDDLLDRIFSRFCIGK